MGRKWWIYSYAEHEINPLFYVLVIRLFAVANSNVGETELASFGVYFDRDGLVQGVNRNATQMNLGGLRTPAMINNHSQTTMGGQIQTETHTETLSR